MIIDFHTHTFPDRIADSAIHQLSLKAGIFPHSDGTNAGLLRSMEKAGVDLSVIQPVATSAAQVVKVNDASLHLNEQYEGRLLSFACMHPDFPNPAEELRRVRELGFKGIKLHLLFSRITIFFESFSLFAHTVCFRNKFCFYSSRFCFTLSLNSLC